MNRSLINAAAPLAISVLLAMLTTSVDAQTAKASKSKAVKTKSQSKAAAAGAGAAAAVVAITTSQLDIAARVLTGKADCESNQYVDVDAIAAQPGHFKVGFKNVSYTMTPEETTTGAVRLEDKKSGVVWLQIPSKSMLMSQKIGQRMVDGCTHSEQRAAIDSATNAATNATPNAAKPAAPNAATDAAPNATPNAAPNAATDAAVDAAVDAAKPAPAQ